MPHVLVVDDDSALRQIIAEALVDAGYDVRQAANGIEALDAVRADPPEVVLLDLSMPIIDGWEFVDAWHTSGARQGGRLVVISGVPGAEATVEGIRPDAFLAKPFDVERLIETVRGLTRETAPLR